MKKILLGAFFWLTVSTCLYSNLAVAQAGNNAPESEPQAKPCITGPDRGLCVDVSSSTAVAAMKGGITSYLFTSESPEIRFRTKSTEKADWFLTLGTPLATSLNKSTPPNAQSTQSSTLNGNPYYLAIGITSRKPIEYALLPPTFFGVGVGYMNHQVDRAKGTYDKGGFVYFTLTVPLFTVYNND